MGSRPGARDPRGPEGCLARRHPGLTRFWAAVDAAAGLEEGVAGELADVGHASLPAARRRRVLVASADALARWSASLVASHVAFVPLSAVGDLGTASRLAVVLLDGQNALPKPPRSPREARRALSDLLTEDLEDGELRVVIFAGLDQMEDWGWEDAPPLGRALGEGCRIVVGVERADEVARAEAWLEEGASMGAGVGGSSSEALEASEDDLWALMSAAEAMARAGGAALEDDGADGTALRAWLYPTLVRAALSSREAESRPDDWDEQPLGELDPGWRDVALDPTPWQAALAAVAARLPASEQGALAAACGEVTDAAVLVRWLRLGMAPPASLEGLRPVDPPEVAVELAAHVDEGQARSLLREAVAAEGAAWRCVRGAEALDAERRVWLAEASASMSPLQRRLLLAHLLPLLEDSSAFFDEAAALLDPYVKGGEVSSEATYGSFPIASAMGALVAVADGATRLRWAEALTEIEAGPKAWLAVALVGALARGGDEARAWGLVTALEGVDERSHGEALVALGGAGDRRADERLAAGFAGFAERTREMLLREHPARLVEVLGSDVALAAACALPDGYVRVAALAALVPFLGSRAGEAAEAAMAAYAAEPDGTTRIALLEVGAWLERPRAVALLREALEAHDSLGDALAGRTGVVGLLPLMAKVAGDGAATVAGVLLDVRRWMG